MLKRDGQLCKYTVPDFVGKLTPAEFDAYNEAFDAIKDEFVSLERIKNDLKELTLNPESFTIPDAQIADQSIIDSSEGECNALLWDIRSRLLKLSNSQIFLCERTLGGSKQKEFAVIEHFNENSEYGKANGRVAVLLAGNDPILLVQDFADNAGHTLRFMASNIVATAQKIVWERFANQNPCRVVRAISERCAKAAGEAQNELQAEILADRISKRELLRQSMGRGV